MFTSAYIYRKNGKTVTQEYSFRRLLKNLKDRIVGNPVSVDLKRPGLLPDGYYGPYVMESIAETKMMPVAVQASKEIEAAFPNHPNSLGGTSHPKGDEHGMYIENEAGDVVSMLTWYPFEGHVWIGTAWTHPKHRGLGLYRALYERLKMEAPDHGLAAISCGVSGGNIVSEDTHEALGMERVVTTFTEHLPPKKLPPGSPRTPAQFMSR